MKNIRITEHGVKLLDELQKIREAFQASDDLSLDQQDQLADAYLAKATPYETQIIEEIFDANNNQTETLTYTNAPQEAINFAGRTRPDIR